MRKPHDEALADTLPVPELELEIAEPLAPVPKLIRAARILMSQRIQKHEDMESTMQVSRHRVPQWLRAAGECSLKQEVALFENVLAYCNTLVLAGHAKASVLHKVKYDEIQMHIRCSYAEGPLRVAFAKVFCVLESWSIVMSSAHLTNGHLQIEGSFAPKVKVAQSATGESIAKVIEETLAVPGVAISAKMPIWRLLETDECAANLRGEKILAAQKGHPPKMHIICSGHKCHQVASKTWEFFNPLHSAVVKTLVFLRSAGIFPRFLQTIMNEMDSLVVISTDSLDADALRYRDIVLSHFIPRARDSLRAHTICQVLSENLLSGDWRVPGRLEQMQGSTLLP